FSRTTRWLADTWGHETPAYTTDVVAAQAGPLRTSQGLELIASRRFDEVEACDTLLVAGGIGVKAAIQEEVLLDWLKQMAGKVDRLGSVCSGAMLLAAAGLLDGRRATTHWGWCDRLAALVPGCTVEPDAIFVESDGIFTSAGVTTGMDLAL